MEAWTAGASDEQLVPQREDLEMQRRPVERTKNPRMQQRSDNGHDGSSLFGMAAVLIVFKAYRVSASHSSNLNEYDAYGLFSGDR